MPAKRTALSLFIDDTHFDPPGQVTTLMAFCRDQGVRGKVSLISAFDCGADRQPLRATNGPAQREFLATLRGASAQGFDVHMELMTHDRLWDFSAQSQRQDGPCEGIWLYDPAVPVAAYEAYFAGILDHAAQNGVTINGVSVPGCDCDRCARSWADLQARGIDAVSPNAVAALLSLARQGRFGAPVVAVYSDAADARHPTQLLQTAGPCAVYDARLDMSVQDQIGFDGRPDADAYITSDGQHGRIPDLVLAGAEQCFFCAHWFSMNPTEPEAWAAFQTIIRRINATLGDRIDWVTPSAYGARLLARETADVSQG